MKLPLYSAKVFLYVFCYIDYDKSESGVWFVLIWFVWFVPYNKVYYARPIALREKLLYYILHHDYWFWSRQFCPIQIEGRYGVKIKCILVSNRWKGSCFEFETWLRHLQGITSNKVDTL